MKTLGVRVSELEQKRLTELAIKKGGTVSDCVRQIVSQFFDQTGKEKNETAEHEKTRAILTAHASMLDGALLQQNHDIEVLKEVLNNFGQTLGQFLTQKEAAK